MVGIPPCREGGRDWSRPGRGRDNVGRRATRPLHDQHSGGSYYLVIAWLAQHVAATPDGLDVVLTIRHTGEFLTQLANENVDDLDFWLVHAAIEMVEKHLLGDRHALAQRQEFQHPVFFAGKIDALPTDLDGLAIEVDDEIADLDDRLSMSLGAAHDGMDARHQLVLVERLSHVIVTTETQAVDLVLDARETGQDQDRGLDLGYPQGAQHFEPRHVRQVKVQQDNVVVVQFAEIDALFSKVRRVDIEALGFEHQFDRLRGGAINFNQQNAHASPSLAVA